MSSHPSATWITPLCPRSTHVQLTSPHLMRQEGNRPSRCIAVPRTLAQTPQLERQGGESPPLRAHLGDPHPAQVHQLERPRRAHAPLSLSRHSPWQSRVPNAAHPTHMYTLPSPFPSTSGPMADREVKRTAHVRGLSENALSRQMHTGFSFFPCHATHNGQYPMCSLALISSQGRGRPRTLMLPV